MVAVNYLWNPRNDNIVREFDDAGGVVAEYTTEPEAFGDVVSQDRHGDDSYFHFDAMGSTLATTNQAATVSDTRAYTAFGESAEQSGTTEFPFQYVGRKGYYCDDTMSKYFVRRRPLDTVSGRWLSEDPIHTRRLPNYTYCYNMPLQCIDPSGTIAILSEASPADTNGQCGAIAAPLPGINTFAQCVAGCNAMGASGKLTPDQVSLCIGVCLGLTTFGCFALGKFCYTLVGSGRKRAAEVCLLLCLEHCDASLC